jgi:hypothetical protein
MNLADKYLVAFAINWLALSGIFWYKQMYGMSLLWLSIFLQVCLVEATSFMYTGYTVTQIFEHLVEKDPGTGWLLLAGMLLNWVLLLVHLSIKTIR